MKIQHNRNEDGSIDTDPSKLYTYVVPKVDTLVIESSNEAYREPSVRIEFSPSETLSILKSLYEAFEHSELPLSKSIDIKNLKQHLCKEK